MAKEKKEKKPYFRTKGPCKSYTQEYLEEMTKKLIKWTKREESCTFIEFLGLNGLDYEKCDRMGAQYPPLAKAKKAALLMIGAKREAKALNGEWDAGTVRKSMALYDPMMKKHELEMKGHDIAAKAAAQVAIMDYSGMGDIKKQLDALKKENEELKAKLAE